MNLSSTADTPPIYHVPTEILDRIFSSVNIWQLTILRQVCSHWRFVVDKPFRWKRISLFSKTKSTTTIATLPYLWTLDSLRYLLNPHLYHIQSLKLSGVRDSSIRFILTHCPQLENLEIMSWNTLSNHAIALENDIHGLKLRRLTIMGSVDQFLALDAHSLVHFILHCPSIYHLAIHQCRLSIHPDIFLKEIQNQLNGSCLNALTTMILSSLELPWSRHHVDQLLVLCPRLYHLHLESKNNTIIMVQQQESKYIAVQ